MLLSNRARRLFGPFVVFLLLGIAGCQNPQSWESDDAYLQAAAVGGGEWEAPGALGQLYFNQGDYKEAIRCFEQAVALSPAHRRAYYLEWLATCQLVLRDYEAARATCERIRAVDPNELTALATRLKVIEAIGDPAEGRRLCELATLRRAVGLLDEADLLRFHARFLADTGEVERAIAIYEDLLSRGTPALDFVDHLRLLYAQTGRYADAYAAWRRKWATGLVYEEGNLLGDRFRNVEQLSARAAAEPGLETRLAAGYAEVGWTDEARALLGRVLAARPDDPEALRLLDSLDRTGRLIERVQEEVYAGYRAFVEDEGTTPIDETLERIEAHADECGFDLPEEEIEDLSLFHHFVNPHVGVDSALPTFFRSQGMLFVLFDYFGPVECNLKDLLLLDPARTRKVWDESVQYEVAVCESSRIYHFREFLGGSSYGGLAISPQGFWLDLDTYRRIARHISGYYLRHRSSYEALFNPADMPADRAPDAVYYSARLKERLAYLVGLQFADQAGGKTDRIEEDVTRALVESAEYHELGHLVVQRSYLPISANIFKGLGLLLTEGFSSEEIGAWSEEQAQLTSLAHSDFPHLALYRTVSSLSKSAESSRHARGYRRILAGFVEVILASPGDYPNIRTDLPIVEQLHLLTGDQIRRIAAGLYRG